MYICSTNDYICHTHVIQNNKTMKKEGKRMYSYRVPESLYEEIDRMVKLRINEYERKLLINDKEDLSISWERYKKANWYESESVDVEKVLWEQFQRIEGIERKLNPADYTLDKGYKEAILEVKKGDSGNLLSNVEFKVVESKKIEPQVVETKAEIESLPANAKFVSNDAKKDKVKALQEMADTIKNGGGSKSMSFTTVKKPIDEIYDCISVEKGVPAESDRVYYGTNNRVAFWDRDDVSVYYANWENKYYQFANSKEFHKFCKDNNIK